MQTYLDNEVRRVSDDVAAVGGFRSLGDVLKESLARKQKKTGRFRQAMAHLAESSPIEQAAMAPEDRETRERKKRRKIVAKEGESVMTDNSEIRS